MADSKIYLNVPFAQKDAAKSLGARWDAGAKKWYVPAGKELGLFAQWQPQASSEVLATPAKAAPRRQLPAVGNGVVTAPADRAFVAYSGEAPPWN